MSAYSHRLHAFSLAYVANVPVLIWGNPGEGKSAVVEAFARWRKITAEVVVASMRDPSDINGMPVVGPDGAVRFAPPAWLVSTNASDNSLLVFDEITLAPPATRGACLRVINERVSADTQLNQTTRIVAVANPPEIAEDGWTLGAPMSNRFVHLPDWEMGVEDFAAGLTAEQWPEVPQIEVSPERLAQATEETNAAVAGFLRAHPDLLRSLPLSAEERQYAWPSPRSWSMCAKLLAYAQASDAPTEVVALLVEGCVGSMAAPEFLAFWQALSLPDPEALLADPTGWEVSERGDLTWAVLQRLISYLAALPESDRAQWKAAGQVIAHAAEVQGDVAVAAAHEWYGHAARFGPLVMPKELTEGRFAQVFDLIRGN